MRTLWALTLLATGLLAQGTDVRPRDEFLTLRPKHNASYVPDDDEAVRGLVAQATQKAAAGDHDGAIEALQALLMDDLAGLVPLRGRELFVAPRRWAMFALLSERAPFTKEVLAAWRRVHDQGANVALQAALDAGDESAIETLVRRYPAATLAPAALLVLSDRALQRGDVDRARSCLARSAEHVPISGLDLWRQAAPFARRAEHLESIGPREPAHWPTLNGGPSRARVGDSLPEPSQLKRLWIAPFLEEVPPTFEHRSAFTLRDHSPILPFYPVLDAERVFLHLGGRVLVLQRKSGRLLYYAPGGEPADEHEVDSMIASTPGVRAVTVAGGTLYFNRLVFDDFSACEPHNFLTAFDLERKSVAWVAGLGRSRDPVLNKRIFFRGAPAVSGDRLYVYGAVREQSEGKPSRKEEAYLFCLDRHTGQRLWHRFLGYGDTDAAPKLPPQSGVAPALDQGVVVAVTGLGVAAALDSTTGEILWLLRYDRKPPRERQRLTESDEEQAHPGDGWLREPPRIVGNTVLFAPADGEGCYACWLRGWRRAQDGQFYSQRWYRRRDANPGQNSLLEQLAGVARDRVLFVGRRDERRDIAESYQTVVSSPVDRTQQSAYGRIPALEREAGSGRAIPPEVFGRVAIAGDMLLVPTRTTLFRFDVRRVVPARDDDTLREIGYLAPYYPAPEVLPKGSPRPPLFGSLVSIDGRLYAVTASRVICYGAR
ncbi:MAG: outer membrane protein assembly factor BamB family protein [Planctomycetota bacterium]